MDNETLIKSLVLSGVLKSSLLIQAFRMVDRKDFVVPEARGFAYVDVPLRLPYNQTISQPTTVAFMLELLDLELSQKVLEVGSASGWLVSVMAHAVGEQGKVIGVERLPQLVKLGQANIKKYDLPQAEVRPAGMELGLPGEAPFDRILVSAEYPEVPKSLLQQLGPGGILVMPVEHSLIKVKKTATSKLVFEEYPGFVFVPLIVEEE